MLVLQIETDEGVVGVSSTGYAAASVYPYVESVLAPAVVGEDPFRTDWLWEKMFRRSIGWAREGVSSSAISLIDVALWDLKGKALNQPVYNLLGGKTKDKIRVYASHLYVYASERADPDLGLLREEAAIYVDQGFTAVKQRFGFGPWDGIEGMRKNRALVKTLRESIGDDIELMVDCCRSFDADYAIKMARMVEDFDLAWLEEPVQPHNHAGYVKVRQAASMPISGGENEYSKHAFRRWAEMGCADIWQPDINRAAGVTEVQKIVHMAASFDIPVIPHGGWASNFHLVMASNNIPMAEYFPREEGSVEVFSGAPVAENGYIELSDKPGFGLELNEDVLGKYTWNE
jgi:L-alanine-DL-glutamate epimerase-like enolase superfamily enzyme